MRIKKTIVRDVCDYRNYNCDALIALVKNNVNWQDFSNLDDSDYLWNSIYSAIIDIYRAMRYRERLIVLYRTTNSELYLRIDNRRQGPFWWRCTIVGTLVWLLRSITCIIYLLSPYFMVFLLI